MREEGREGKGTAERGGEEERRGGMGFCCRAFRRDFGELSGFVKEIFLELRRNSGEESI